MKPIVADTDDRRWQAVCERDTRADGQFVFAVLTTGICCRPSCRSRRARRENVRFFADVAAAVAAGFRPCKRCQPDKDYPQQQRVDKVAQACRLLEQDAPLTLEALAGQLAMSPFHFHRLFKSVTGMTPKAWQQAWRAQRLREALEQGIPVTRAALAAAAAGGYPEFSPDACLINRYCPGAKLSLHQDKDEQDLRAPIVSVSLGLPAIFQFGGLQRSDPLQRLLLEHGDVVVWGGESRLFYHGIQPLKAGHHPETGDCRYNLTFRQAGGRQY